MTLSPGETKAPQAPALAKGGARSKAWLGLLGLATVTALAVFAAVRAAGAGEVAGPVGLVVLLFGAVSAVLLYRASRSSPSRRALGDSSSAEGETAPTTARRVGVLR